MLKRAADRQDVRAAADGELQFPVLVFLDGANRADAHDHASMHLPERFGIQRGQQLLERRANVPFARLP